MVHCGEAFGGGHCVAFRVCPLFARDALVSYNTACDDTLFATQHGAADATTTQKWRPT
jgi:hypothetical protein